MKISMRCISQVVLRDVSCAVSVSVVAANYRFHYVTVTDPYGAAIRVVTVQAHTTRELVVSRALQPALG